MALHTAKPQDKQDIASGGLPGVTYSKKELSGSEVELEITVSAERFNEIKESVYKYLAPQTSISGFRPGKAPRNMIEARLGARLFEETFNRLIPQVTTEVIVDAKINPLDYANYEVKDLAPEGNFTFIAKVVVFPEIKLPDFAKLKTKPEKAEIKESEVEDLFKKLEEDIVKSKQAEDKEFTADKIDWKTFFNDSTISTVEEVKEALRKSLLTRKESELEEKYVGDLVKEAIDLAKIPVPDSLMHKEAHRREHEYVERIEKLGIKLDDFLKSQKTDIEALRKNWHEDARLILASDLLFLNIARTHGLVATDEDITAEIEKIEDEKIKAQYKSEDARSRIGGVIVRQKSLAKLKELSNK